jgi:hypothetical protein
MTATLVPRTPNAASITLHIESPLDLVDFSFGEFSPTWELPTEGRNPAATEEELLQELKEMCRAVIAGQCEHKLGLLSVSGTVRISGQPSTVTDWFVPHIVSRRVQYSSYARELGDNSSSRTATPAPHR